MKKILLIDDDPVVHTIINNIIKNEFELVSLYSVKETEFFLQNNELNISIILIDRVLPDGDGLSICSMIRSDNGMKDLPIFFLSGKNSESDKITGLYAGADDYIAKPFSPLELKARIHSRFRTAPKKIIVEKLMLDIESHRAFLLEQGQTEIILTRTEFKLLLVLSQSVDRVFDREILISKVWGNTCHLNDRVIDTHISHLRKKLIGTNLKLEALRGEGYRIRAISNLKEQVA